MAAKILKRWPVAPVLLLLALQLIFPRNAEAQDAQQQLRSIWKNFVIVPASHNCYPVEVTGISLTGVSPNVLLAQVIVENRSEKPITAVKLSWRVHVRSVTVTPDLFCGIPPAEKVLLAGETPLIELGDLAPKETSIIGPNPLVSEQIPATKTVFINHPILTTDDVKTLPVDGTRQGAKYNVALYVSEFQYADGTTWTFKNN